MVVIRYFKTVRTQFIAPRCLQWPGDQIDWRSYHDSDHQWNISQHHNITTLPRIISGISFITRRLHRTFGKYAGIILCNFFFETSNLNWSRLKHNQSDGDSLYYHRRSQDAYDYNELRRSTKTLLEISGCIFDKNKKKQFLQRSVLLKIIENPKLLALTVTLKVSGKRIMKFEMSAK